MRVALPQSKSGHRDFVPQPTIEAESATKKEGTVLRGPYPAMMVNALRGKKHTLLHTQHQLEVWHVTEFIARCSILKATIECECLRSRALAHAQQWEAPLLVSESLPLCIPCRPSFQLQSLQITPASRWQDRKGEHVTCAVGFI